MREGRTCAFKANTVPQAKLVPAGSREQDDRPFFQFGETTSGRAFWGSFLIKSRRACTQRRKNLFPRHTAQPRGPSENPVKLLSPPENQRGCVLSGRKHSHGSRNSSVNCHIRWGRPGRSFWGETPRAGDGPAEQSSWVLLLWALGRAPTCDARWGQAVRAGGDRVTEAKGRGAGGGGGARTPLFPLRYFVWCGFWDSP